MGNGLSPCLNVHDIYIIQVGQFMICIYKAQVHVTRKYIIDSVPHNIYMTLLTGITMYVYKYIPGKCHDSGTKTKATKKIRCSLNSVCVRVCLSASSVCVCVCSRLY